MAAVIPNIWHHRRVADSSAKACWICFKPSSSVLITPNQKDFFYICTGHLQDRTFCQPDADEAKKIAAKKKKEEMDQEIENVKKEYEAKLKRQKEQKEEKAKKEEKGKKEKDEKKEEEQQVADAIELSKIEKERDEKINGLSKQEAKAEDAPRIYILHKNFHQMRVDRIHKAELAKRNRERLKTPGSFPSVPTGEWFFPVISRAYHPGDFHEADDVYDH